MLVANVRLFFVPSVSVDIVKRVLKVRADQSAMEVNLPLAATEHVLQVKASTNLQFSTLVTDSEGKTVESMVYSTTIGDLTDPLPDTGLGHEILSVEEVPDPVPPVEPEVPVEPAPETPVEPSA